MKLKPRYKIIYEKMYAQGKIQPAKIKSLSNSSYIDQAVRIITEQRNTKDSQRNKQCPRCLQNAR